MNMHVGAPERAQDSLPEGLLAQERARKKAFKKFRKLRIKAEAEVERLLTFLDAVDGYTTTELEDDGSDEPSLGFLDGFPGWGLPGGSDNNASPARQQFATDDREREDEHDEDNHDDEPSLGSVHSCYGGGDQTVWASGTGGDLEDSGLGNDDREEDGLSAGEEDLSDNEPSLGWSVEGQLGRETGDDRELQTHATMEVDKTRPERRKGKRKVQSIEMASSFAGPKMVRNLTKKQYAVVKPRMDYDLPGFQSPTPNTTGLR